MTGLLVPWPAVAGIAIVVAFTLGFALGALFVLDLTPPPIR